MHKKDFFPTSGIFIFMTKLVPNKLCIAFIKLNEILNHTAIDMLPEPTALQQFPQTTIFVSFDTINISIYLYSKCFLSQFYLNIFNILIQMLYISFFFSFESKTFRYSSSKMLFNTSYKLFLWPFLIKAANQIRLYINYFKNQKG